MRILYITYVDFTKRNSGSNIRPVRMYEAFKKLGHEVKLLSGESSFIDSRKNRRRKSAVKVVSKWLDETRPDICYIENTTSPIKLRCDVNLIKKINSLGVPIGYFFRDVYYKFPEDFQLNKGIKKKVIFFILMRMYVRDERLIEKIADVVYLPSETMNKYLGFSITSALPPASFNDLKSINSTYKGDRVSIYVGSISGCYNVDFLIESFKLINEQHNGEYKLILCCREQEYNNSHIKDLSYKWLEIHHASNERLKKLYEKADLALIIHNAEYEYNSFAVPVKLFEYLSYGIPIVSTRCFEIGRHIEAYDVGIVADMTVEAYSSSIIVALDHERNILFRENIVRALANGILWENRAERVIDDLSVFRHVE